MDGALYSRARDALRVIEQTAPSVGELLNDLLFFCVCDEQDFCRIAAARSLKDCSQLSRSVGWEYQRILTDLLAALRRRLGLEN